MASLKLFAYFILLLTLEFVKVAVPSVPWPGGYLIIGGKNRKDVEYFHRRGDEPSGDCDSFADVPFVTNDAIALKDSNGMPMVCGGSKNPDPKSCYVFDNATNSWVQGPSMKRERVGATVTCLVVNGVCWIFGGEGTSVTEFYNPTTNEFELGPDMPLESAHVLCTAVGASNFMYMVVRQQPGIARAFTFHLGTKTFAELPSINVTKSYVSCLVDNKGNEKLFVIGGSSSACRKRPTSTTHFYDSLHGNWSVGPEYPFPVYASTAFQYEFWATYSEIYGGVISADGTETGRVFALEFDINGDYYFEEVDASLSARSYALAVYVDNVCPGAST